MYLRRGQGDPTEWVSSHRFHHLHTDTPLDPHSPYEGFWWSHMGWLLDEKVRPMQLMNHTCMQRAISARKFAPCRGGITRRRCTNHMHRNRGPDNGTRLVRGSSWVRYNMLHPDR